MTQQTPPHGAMQGPSQFPIGSYPSQQPINYQPQTYTAPVNEPGSSPEVPHSRVTQMAADNPVSDRVASYPALAEAGRDATWADPASFPIVAYYRQTHYYMMANTKWNLDQLCAKILLNVGSQTFEPVNLEVRWEVDLPLVIRNPIPYPEKTLIVPRKVRAILELLKRRNKSDLIVVEEGPLVVFQG